MGVDGWFPRTAGKPNHQLNIDRPLSEINRANFSSTAFYAAPSVGSNLLFDRPSFMRSAARLMESDRAAFATSILHKDLKLCN
jgi:hypothetical protein